MEFWFMLAIAAAFAGTFFGARSRGKPLKWPTAREMFPGLYRWLPPEKQSSVVGSDSESYDPDEQVPAIYVPCIMVYNGVRCNRISPLGRFTCGQCSVPPSVKVIP